MGNNGTGFSERSRYGLHGDVCVELIGKGKAAADMNPNSVFFFAAWQACKELGRHFQDDHGVRFEDAAEVNHLILGPLGRLIASGGFEKETKASIEALQGLVRGLPDLRMASASGGEHLS